MKVSLTLLALIFVFQASAQDGPRFQPARPPPLDNDFDDPIEEEAEYAPPPMPPAPSLMPGVPLPNVNGQTPSSPPATTDFRPSHNNSNLKVRFEVVDGEFYEKGKPRGRAPIGKRARE